MKTRPTWTDSSRQRKLAGRFWYLPELPNETRAVANDSNGRVLDGPITEPVNIYYFLLDFPFEARNIFILYCVVAITVFMRNLDSY